jgi:NitT/TauT family transport system ATP-binding protein
MSVEPLRQAPSATEAEAEAGHYGHALRTGLVEIRDLSVDFEAGGHSRRVIGGVNLTIHPGEFVCLLGPTGCGKSTLLNCIAGFVQPSRGSVRLDGQDVHGPGPERGMVFQQHSLFPWKTVLANVAFGPLMAGVGRREAEARARGFLALVGLAEFGNHYPHTLSGGMQQRVGIARALANSPSVLLMDEPFGALDAQTRTMMQETLARLWQEFRGTVVFVTHDVEEAVFLADRVLVMSASPGRLVADVSVSLPRPRSLEVITSPAFVSTKRHCLELVRGETLKNFSQNGR